MGINMWLFDIMVLENIQKSFNSFSIGFFLWDKIGVELIWNTFW